MVINMKKWTIAIVVVLVALFVLVVAYMADNPNAADETMSFNVSSGSWKSGEYIKDIKTHHKEYDPETVKWMESLGNKQIFFGNDSIIIMNDIDARKLHQDVDVTDVYIYHHFTAEVVETHNLTEGRPVHYVKNVNYINQEIVDTGLA